MKAAIWEIYWVPHFISFLKNTYLENTKIGRNMHPLSIITLFLIPRVNNDVPLIVSLVESFIFPGKYCKETIFNVII